MHEGRESCPFARYFLTLCAENRRPLLTHPTVTDAIRAELDVLAGAGDIEPVEWVIMPDHIHLLFGLGHRLSLGKVVARLKSKTGPALESVGVEWQRDYYEHRLRPDELAEAYAAYIFLNPYRARLISVDTPWPHRGRGRIRWEFEEHLRPGGLPSHAWLAEVELPAGW